MLLVNSFLLLVNVYMLLIYRWKRLDFSI